MAKINVTKMPEEKTIIEIVFESGKKATVEISERTMDWIQMFFEANVRPNPRTFGKIAERNFNKEKTSSVGIYIGNNEITIS